MPRFKVVRSVLVVLLVLCLCRPGAAQVGTVPFTSGPIPPCDTSTFTANVSGVGFLIIPDGWSWGSYLESVLINITSDHPQTLQISLTSPAGTTLLLSAFNGAGGQNYTNTNFSLWAWNNINTGTAPFTGTFMPQGGSLDVFAGEYGDGTWTITVIDTACANGGTGPGGTWTPGWFNGGVGSGAFSFGFASPPPPCMIDMGWQTGYVCPGETVDVLTYFENNWGGFGVAFTVWNAWTGAQVTDPTAVGTPGQYNVQAGGMVPGDCFYYGTYDVQAVPAVSLGPDQVVDQCSGAGSVDLSALFTLTGVLTQTWTLDGLSIPTAMAVAAQNPGVYQLIGQSAGGCSDTALVTLNFLTDPVLGPDQAVSTCAGTSIDLTTLYSTGADVTAWTESGVPVADPTSVTSAGIYTLTVTNAAGCMASADVTLAVQAMPSLGADQSLDLCSNASLDLTSLYTTTGLTAAWTLMGVPVADPTAVIAAGTYQLVGSNGSGCTDTALVFVNAIASPALGPDAPVAACAGNVVDLTSYFTTSGLTTIWTSSGAAVPDPTSVGTTGVYTLIATNATGCSDTADVDVTVSANPVLGPDQSITECDGTVVDLTALYAIGANTAAWTESGVPVADPTAVTNGGSYTLTVTNGAGCSATAMVTLALDPAPALGTDQLASICAGSTFDLTSLYSTTGFTVAWTLGGAAVADPTTVAVTGDYQLVVTNGFACTDTALVIFTVNPNPSLGADLSFALCPWQTVDLGTVFPIDDMTATYLLNGQPVVDPTAVSDTGTYYITVTDMNGCFDDATASVSAIECLCVADFIHDARCIQEPVQFTLLADSTVLGATWDFADAADLSMDIDPLVKFNSEGEVVVTLRAMLSCGVVNVERAIRMQDCTDSCSVWIPSAFTPDNDSRNDSWTWHGECRPEEFSIQVFNRWGELVFASTDPLDSWDGTYRGTSSPSGVYVYRVGYRLPYQKRKEVMGSITLAR